MGRIGCRVPVRAGENEQNLERRGGGRTERETERRVGIISSREHSSAYCARRVSTVRKTFGFNFPILSAEHSPVPYRNTVRSAQAGSV